MKKENIWVFLSHSSKDYDKVCLVRNELEKHRFRPLMFFLKCLDDDYHDEEVKSLIFREIDSRSRFVLCDSSNAQNSDWVKKEVEYIQEKNRFFFTIDLDRVDDYEYLSSEVSRFVKRSTVILAYSHHDIQLVKELKEQLIRNDFIVYDLLEHLTEEDYDSDEMAMSIKDIIAAGGYFLPLISRYFMRSQWCHLELKYASQCLNEPGYRKIIPVQIEDITPFQSLVLDSGELLLHDAYSNVISIDEAPNRRSMLPNERIISNILDILYWEDMENEVYIQTESLQKEAQRLYESGYKLYYSTDHDHERADHAAASFLRKAAILGHPEAMLLLADCYKYGCGVIQDTQKARALVKKAENIKSDNQTS
jgi:hypothetical protein